MSVRRIAPKVDLEPDWVVITLPAAIAIQYVSPNASLFAVAALVAIAYIRKSESNFNVQMGPLLLLFAASAIVLSRPESYSRIKVILLAGLLVIRIARTVDARRIIASLIDGCGLFVVINASADLLAIRPAISTALQSVLKAESATGYVRTVFPFTGGLNNPTIVAGAYLVAIIFLLREPGLLKLALRLICSAAAVYILIGVSSRTALGVTVVLSIVAVAIPAISNRITQITTLFVSVSAVAFPLVYDALGFAIKPLTGLASRRSNTEYGVVSLQGREEIWDNAVQFWNEKVNGLSHILFGFGEDGQFRSGVSATYSYVLHGYSVRDHTTVHNAFLQQLFDGGVIGWLLLTLAVYWASARLSKRIRDWGHWAKAAIFTLTAILLGSVTESIMAPGSSGETFWLLMFLVGLACQEVESESDEAPGPAPTDSSQVWPVPGHASPASGRAQD